MQINLSYDPKFKYYFIDLFCGFGGTSYGITECHDMAELIWAVNHDPKAIASHQLNNPKIKHSIEDIRTLDLTEMAELVRQIRINNPLAVICLWASLECTNHSNAKGGMSRDADSRTLANHLFRYVEAINPDMVWIENVKEFKQWGPLMHKVKDGVKQFVKKGKDKGKPVMVPIKEKKGTHYKKWVNRMVKYKYKHGDKMVNAADFGGITSRNRIFVQFVKKPLEIHWPKPTHDKKGRFGLPVWKPVRPVLNLEDTGDSIFRDPPLCDNTYIRIDKGARRHSDPQFFIKYYSSGGQWQSIDEPCGSLTCKDRFGLMTKQFFYNEYSNGGDYNSLNGPAPTIPTNPKTNLMSIQFLIDAQYKNEGSSVDKPCPALIARMDKKPKYLVNLSYGFEHVKIRETDSDVVKALKMYMQEEGIADIKMRGLYISEMLQIMGFPADYKMVGTKTDHKKFIGNAVETGTAKVLISTSFEKNKQLYLNAA
jgi:DNA (cytosine-5)-methyltransferase 1